MYLNAAVLCIPVNLRRPLKVSEGVSLRRATPESRDSNSGQQPEQSLERLGALWCVCNWDLKTGSYEPIYRLAHEPGQADIFARRYRGKGVELSTRKSDGYAFNVSAGGACHVVHQVASGCTIVFPLKWFA